MITIYIHGCSTCGVNSVYVNRVKAYAEKNNTPVELKNSKYDPAAAKEQLSYIQGKFGTTGQYLSIVVEDEEVFKLREWNK